MFNIKKLPDSLCGIHQRLTTDTRLLLYLQYNKHYFHSLHAGHVMLFACISAPQPSRPIPDILADIKPLRFSALTDITISTSC